MKTLSPSLILCGLLLLPASVSRAEPSKEIPPLPPGPLIQKRAPVPAQWTVTATSMPQPGAKGAQTTGTNSTTQSGTNSAAPASDAKILSVKGFLKGSKTVRITFGSGPEAVNVWNVEGEDLMENSSGRFSIVSDYQGIRNPYRTDLSRSDFPEMEWINAGAYTGQATYKKAPCLVFTKIVHVDANKDLGIPAKDVPTTAFVSIEGRLPVALFSEGELREWTWQPTPTSDVQPPAGALATIRNHKIQVRAMTSGPVKP
jgi:hypothetical protein